METKKPTKKPVTKPAVKKKTVKKVVVKKKKAIEDPTRFKNILFLISDSGFSLRKSLIINKMSSETFFEWLEVDPNNAKLYTCACALRADAIAEEIFDIADDANRDTMQIYDRSGKLVDVPDLEWIQRSKLRIDVRKWAAAKLNPKKYGDKLDVVSDGEKLKAAPPVIINLGNGTSPDEIIT